MAEATIDELVSFWESQPNHVDILRIREDVGRRYIPKICQDGVQLPANPSGSAICGLYFLQTGTRALDVAGMNPGGIVGDTLNLVAQKLVGEATWALISGLSELGCNDADLMAIAASDAFCLVELPNFNDRANYCASWVSYFVFRSMFEEACQICVSFGMAGVAKEIVRQLELNFTPSKADIIDRSNKVRCFESIKNLMKRISRMSWNLNELVAKYPSAPEMLTCPYASDGGAFGFVVNTNTCPSGKAHKIPSSDLLAHLNAVHPNHEDETFQKCKYCEFPYVLSNTELGQVWMGLQHKTECRAIRGRSFLSDSDRWLKPSDVLEVRKNYKLPGPDSVFAKKDIPILGKAFNAINSGFYVERPYVRAQRGTRYFFIQVRKAGL